MIKFSPDGMLDIATDPADLPEQSDGKNVKSGAMTRCTNLRLDQAGMASTRFGSRDLKSSVSGTCTRIIQQGSNRYIFAGGTVYKNETSIGSAFDHAVSAVLYNAYNQTEQVIFAIDGTDRKKIEDEDILEWGIDAPEDAYAEDIGEVYTYDWEESSNHASTAAVKLTRSGDPEQFEYLHNWENANVIRGIDSTYTDDFAKACFWFESYDEYEETTSISWAGHKLKFTYARYVGDTLICESNPSPELLCKEDRGGAITWDDPTDSQVTHIRVYATADGGASFYYHSKHEIADQQALLYKNVTQLGTVLETDHDRPPAGSVVVGPNFNGQLFILKDNLLYYSKPQQPEYWPADYYVEVSAIQFPLQSACFWNGQLYVQSATEIYLVQGTGAGIYMPLPMKAITGSVGPDAVAPIQGKGIYHLGNDGIYLFSGGLDSKISEDSFGPLWRGEESGGIPAVNVSSISSARMVQYREKIYFFYPGGSSAVADECLVTDLRHGRTAHYNYNDTGFRQFLWDNTNDRLIAVDGSGSVWQLEDDESDTDAGTSIAWELRSKEFNNLRRHFPRSARWDAGPVTGGTMTGTVYLDGVAKQDHAIIQRNTKKRLISICNGERLTVGLAGTGPGTIYACEVD